MRADDFLDGLEGPSADDFLDDVGAKPGKKSPGFQLPGVMDPMGIAKPVEPRVSVLQDIRAPFNFAQASAARRAMADANGRAVMQEMSAAPQVDDGFAANAARVIRRVVDSINQGASGIVRNVGDVTGIEPVSRFAKASSDASRRFAGKTAAPRVKVDGFAPGSIVQDLPGAAEGAMVSIGTQAPALATGSLPAALAIMFGQTYGDSYNEARDHGLDIAPAMGNATGNAAFEVVGERVGGMPGTIKALQGAIAGNAPARVAAEMVRAGLRDIPGEQLTHAGQFTVNAAPGIGINDNPTLDAFLEGAKDTALATVLQGGMMAGGGAGLARVRQAAMRPGAQAEPAQAPMPASAVVDPVLTTPDQKADAFLDEVPQGGAPETAMNAAADSIISAIEAADQAAAAGRVEVPQSAPQMKAMSADEFLDAEPQTDSHQLHVAEPIQAPPEPEKAVDVERAEVQPTPGEKAAELESGAPQDRQPVQQQQARADGVRLGMDSVPLTEGGRPFGTREEAASAKKLQPAMRVVRVDGGFALADKTKAQLAAEAAAARRLRGASVGAVGAPLSAHAFIMGRGGLAASEMADAGFDRNPRAGNRYLFAGKGRKGLTLAQAAEALREAGYIGDESETAAADIIRRSMREPQYTAEGWESIAQAEAEARYQDYLQAQQEAESDDPLAPVHSLESDGYDRLDIEAANVPPELLAQVAALSAQLDSAEGDAVATLERLALQYPNDTQQEYHERAREAITQELARLAESGGGRSAGAPDGSEARAPDAGGQTDSQEQAEGLTSYTRQDLERRQAQRDAVDAAQSRADREAGQRAQVDAGRDNFALTGSDRAADANPNQGDIFEEGGRYGVEARRREYDHSGQLDLFLSGGPDKSQAGPRGEAAQRDGVAAVDDLHATGALLGQAIARELAANKKATLVGQKVASPEDLAALAQIYRDPRMETFRVVFVDDAGRVVSQLGLTSRMPASAPGMVGTDEQAYMDEMMATARNAGASGFYMLHNHPSGNPTPSTADERLTGAYAGHNKVAGGLAFRGHVVIDTNSYAVIDEKGRSEVFKKDFGHVEPFTEGRWGGLRVSGPWSLMEVAKSIEADEKAVTLVVMDSQLIVRRVVTVPRAAVTRDVSANRRLLHRQAMAARGSRVVAIGADRRVLIDLGSLVVDAIHVSRDGEPVSLAQTGEVGFGSLYPAARRTRVTADTSQEFGYLRDRAKEADEAARWNAAEPGADEADQGRAVERAYGGRKGYDKAKADGRTKLTFAQWVQVRTPAFKKWFGNWEALRAQQRLDAMEPVKVRIPEGWRGLDVAELRSRVRESLDELVASGEPLHHREIGDVSVQRRGIKKAMHSSADPAKLFLLGDLRKAFESSIFAGAEAAQDGAPNVAAYEKLLAKVEIGGVELVATFTVQRQADGRQFYNTVVLQDKEKPQWDYPRDTLENEERAQTANTGVSSFVRRPLSRVNPDSVSKNIDPETGEPTADGMVNEDQGEYGLEKPVRRRSLNPLGRDQVGHFKFKLGEVAFHKLDAVTKPLQNRFGMAMATPELRRQLRQMKATIEEANRNAAKVAEQMGVLEKADRELVSDIVEKTLRPGVVPPEHAVRVADAITKAMDRQTEELVELGMLTPASAERWRGRYLPRIYSKHLELDGEADMAWWKRMMKPGAMMRGIRGDNLKSRGLFEDVPADAVKSYEAMGWEVRDGHWELKQGKLGLKDPKSAPWLAREKVVMWRDFTMEERHQMGEMRDALVRYVSGYTAMQRDIAMGRLFASIAGNPAWVRRSGGDGWARVPDSEIPGTGGVKRYGNLAGLWVRDDVMAHLTQFEEAANNGLQLWRDALGIWKEGKTALNPVAHFNNVVSNLSMAHFAGVSYWDAHKYTAAVRDLVNDAPMVQEGRDVGLFTGSFTKEELVQAMPKELQKLMELPDSAARKAGRQVMSALTYWLRQPLQTAYEFEDVFFKYVIYRDARQRGMEPEEATDYALRYIFTYDDLPSGARKVRDFAIPFFSWSYKAAPALLHTAMVYPWRFLAPAALLHGVNLAAYAVAAGDEDDDWLEKMAKGRELEKEERAVLPEHMKGVGMLANPKTIRLGTDSVTGNPVFMDVSRVIPGGDMFDMENQAGGVPMPAPLMPNHPVLSVFAAMVANKEMFMGREVVDSNDTALEAAEKRAKWMAGFLLPAIAPGGYHSQRVLNATASAADITINVPGLGEFTGADRSGQPVQPGYAVMQTVGVKARPVDLELEASRRRANDSALARSIAAEVRSMARLHQRGAVSDAMMERTRDSAREKLDRIRETKN